jgi:hypothetical protein
MTKLLKNRILLFILGALLGGLITVGFVKYMPELSDNFSAYQMGKHYQDAVAIGTVDKEANKNNLDETLSKLSAGDDLSKIDESLVKFGKITTINQKTYSTTGAKRKFYNNLGDFDYVFFSEQGANKYATTVKLKDKIDVNLSLRNQETYAVYNRSGLSDSEKQSQISQIKAKYPEKYIYRYSYMTYKY